MIDSASVLAVIPARGGSKGIARKNLRKLAGRPLVAHSIEQARRAKHIGRVLVSSDDDEILSVARAAGADVVKRPGQISGDTASSESAILHALEVLAEREDYHPELVVFLQCTSPLTLAQDIDGTVETLVREHADSALAVTRVHYFLWQRGDDGSAVGSNHDAARRQRRQERTPEYLETGAVYVMRTRGFCEAGHRFFGKIALFEMPSQRCAEIDEPQDLHRVSLMMRHGGGGGLSLPEKVSAVVFDFDGVFTDNRVLVDEHGREAVYCSREDGLGVSRLLATELKTIVLSSEANPVVRKRCEKLGIECRQGLDDKAEALRAWVMQNDVQLEHVVYVGNDENDRACLEMAGCGVVVHDAHPSVLDAAQIRLRRKGGRGAVREVIEMVLRNQREEHHDA